MGNPGRGSKLALPIGSRKRCSKKSLGVTGVSNNITIRSETQEQEKIEKKDIESGLRRNWSYLLRIL